MQSGFPASTTASHSALAIDNKERIEINNILFFCPEGGDKHLIFLRKFTTFTFQCIYGFVKFVLFYFVVVLC